MNQLCLFFRSLLLTTWLFFALPGLSQNEELRFKHLTIQDGLSQGTVSCIIQDAAGFMWFGTEDGLNRYDGYDFKIFRPIAQDPLSLPAPDVTCLLLDDQDRLWISSFDGGLSLFHQDTEIFENFTHIPEDIESLSSNLITSMVQDASGLIWLGARDGGVNRFNPATGKVQRFLHDPNNPNSLSGNMISVVYMDRNQQLWAGGHSGLNRLNPETGKVQRYLPNPQNPFSLKGVDIRGISQDANGVLWVSVRGQGLARMDENGQFHHYGGGQLTQSGSLYLSPSGALWVGTRGSGVIRVNQSKPLSQPGAVDFHNFANNPAESFSLSGGDVQSIFEDRSGILWVGVLGNGVNRQDPWAGRFKHYHRGGQPPLNNNMTWAVAEDADRNLWIGTDNGLTRMNRDRTETIHYLYDETNPNGIGGETVLALCVGKDNRIWLGCWNAGLDELIQENGTVRFKHHRHNPADPKSLANDYVYAITEDHLDHLWVGTAAGLSKMDPKRETFTHYRYTGNPNDLSHDEVVLVKQDAHRRIWVGTSGGGLNLYHPEGDNFTHFQKGEAPDTLDGNAINYADSYNDPKVVWVGTNGGLNKLELKPQGDARVTRYGGRPGHPSTAVYQIRQDGEGLLWLSTNVGLARFHPQTEAIRIYDAHDGLQSREFNAGASCVTRDGEMLFGGVNGVNAFFPEKIKDDTSIPNVVVTNFLLANRPARLQRLDPLSPLKRAIGQTSKISLNYKQNVFSFHFAALHYSVPANQQYAYKMKGFDMDWIQTDGRHRVAAYTNLNPGNYTFMVKGSNHDGAWNPEPAVVDVTVLPPPWLSWWAKTGYALAIFSVIFFYVRYQKKKLQFAQALNERQNQVNERLKEMDRLKDDFLANTSHELRTPLNGIIGLTESLLDGAAGPVPPKIKNELLMIVSGGKRLSSLVNDILDFSRLKNRNLILHLRPLDLHTLVNVVLTLSKPLTSGKHIELRNAVPTDFSPVMADENRLQQILHNLIGNSIKFTEAGYVEVSAHLDGDVTVHVKDTGVGIPQGQLAAIFESFEQVEDSLTRSHSGTGLGLAITRQLVELHQGSIEAQSQVGEGSTFSFTLASSSEPAQFITEDRRARLFEMEVESEDAPQRPGPGAGARILVVDDEPVNRRVLRNILKGDGYHVVEVGDGTRALQMLEEDEAYDLILLDVMMPRLSGYDVCTELRKKHPLQELPVIFLTARDRVIDLMAGFQAGGNDFLTKPVSKGELLTRVRNHLSLLDIHRNMDARVQERTQALDLRNRELAQRNEEIIQAQNQLVLNEKMATLGTLAAGVAHEINNPNNFVSGGIQRLKTEHQEFQAFLKHISEDEPEACQAFEEWFLRLTEMAGTIEEGSTRIGEIVRNLSQFTQLDDSTYQETDVLEGLRATLLLLQPSFENVSLVLQPGPPLVLACWPAQLNQVFMNLLLNACEAVEGRPEGEVRIYCEIKDKEAAIYFRDNGRGVGAQHRDNIFEAFFTTKKVGAGKGLGLYTSYRIMEKHGGRISLESKEGQGALFGLHFPIGSPYSKP